MQYKYRAVCIILHLVLIIQFIQAPGPFFGTIYEDSWIPGSAVVTGIGVGVGTTLFPAEMAALDGVCSLSTTGFATRFVADGWLVYIVPERKCAGEIAN